MARPLPGRPAQHRWSPRLAYGRHAGPPDVEAREAAVLVLLMWDSRQWVVPLIRRRHDLPSHAGQIGLPGGAIEPGETSRQAALREAEEELALSSRAVQVVGSLTPLYVFGSKFSVTPWLATCGEPQSLVPNPAEVEELLLPPLADLLRPGSHSIGVRRQRGISFTSPQMICGEHEVWGATCMILGELIELLLD